MNFNKALVNKINSKKAVICIMGLGYVGSQLFQQFYKSGYKTIGLDNNSEKLKLFKAKKRKVILSSNYDVLKIADVIIITLPTPLTKSMTPDLSYLKNCIKGIKKYLKKGQLISLESTTYPGTTNELFVPMLRKKKFKIGEDFFLVYSPERISPELKVKHKEIKFSLTNTPKVYSGYTKNCSELGKLLYKKIITKVVAAPNLETAETVKMIENVFRSVNIALVNELKMFLSKINIDVHKALDIAETKPFGFTKFLPGPGYGGHCIPLDPYYLYWLAKKKNFNLNFIKTSGIINRKITSWISNKIIKFINKKKIKLYRKKILLLGVAYKLDIDDTRESPAFKIAENLKKKGFDFEYSDPYVKKISFHGNIKKSKTINKSLFKKFPIVLIVTNHSKFNYKFISKNAKYLFDSRNTIKNKKENYFKV